MRGNEFSQTFQIQIQLAILHIPDVSHGEPEWNVKWSQGR
uniref:Uncharacterized protein n=1 Tax=Anguilla anguilla TaxID=7936 RepID=A0A0E9R379_ANGAN